MQCEENNAALVTGSANKKDSSQTKKHKTNAHSVQVPSFPTPEVSSQTGPRWPLPSTTAHTQVTLHSWSVIPMITLSVSLSLSGYYRGLYTPHDIWALCAGVHAPPKIESLRGMYSSCSISHPMTVHNNWRDKQHCLAGKLPFIRQRTDKESCVFQRAWGWL